MNFRSNEYSQQKRKWKGARLAGGCCDMIREMPTSSMPRIGPQSKVAIHAIIELDRIISRLERQRKGQLMDGSIFPKTDSPLERKVQVLIKSNQDSLTCVLARAICLSLCVASYC